MPEYFVYKRQGPYGIKTLSQLVQDGEVDNNAFVWTPGMKSLEYAKKMPELKPWFEDQELENKKVKVDVTPYAEAKTTLAPQPATISQVYKVAVNNQSTGPFSLEQLVGKIQAKEVLPQTLVWKPGLAQWMPAQDVTDFSEAFAALPRETPVSDKTAVSSSLQSWAQTAAAGTAEGSPVTEGAESRQGEDLPRTAGDEGPGDFSPGDAFTEGGAGDFPPTDIFNEDGSPGQAAAPYQPVSLLNEGDDDRLPRKKLFLPAALILLGGVVTFLALKTAVFAAPLAKLTSLLSKFPIVGGRVKALAEGAAPGIPLLVKIIPGGLFLLSGILVLVVTLLGQRSSEQFDPEQP